MSIERHKDELIAGRKAETCVAIWRRKPHQATFNLQRSLLDDTVAAHPGKAKFLCVVEEGAPAPDDDIRKASADMVNQHGDKLSKVACVIEGEGFKAAITRTVLAGIGMVIRKRVPMKFFDSVDSAAAWLTEAEGPSAAVDLRSQVRELRKQLDAGPA